MRNLSNNIQLDCEFWDSDPKQSNWEHTLLIYSYISFMELLKFSSFSLTYITL